jgi:hypothetical protein
VKTAKQCAADQNFHAVRYSFGVRRAFVDVVILSECPLLFERAVFLTAIIKLYKRGPKAKATTPGSATYVLWAALCSVWQPADQLFLVRLRRANDL